MAHYSSYAVCHHGHTYECRCYHCLCEDCFQDSALILITDPLDERNGESGFAAEITDQSIRVVFPNGESLWYPHEYAIDIENVFHEEFDDWS